MKTALLIIDAQHDFCHPEGALFVPGAEEDTLRIASLLEKNGDYIHQLIITLDTHQILDISHPGFWSNDDGLSPEPFTVITAADVDQLNWLPRFNPAYVRNYLNKLEAEGEYQHRIWPEHCIVGSQGAALAQPITSAVKNWVHQAGRNFKTITKGLHPFTEHFGAFRAQIPVYGSPETDLNTSLLESLKPFDRILLTGEARSHCIAASIRQILKYAPYLVPKLVVLTDCMSDVAGLGHLAAPIYSEAIAHGVQFTTSDLISF